MGSYLSMEMLIKVLYYSVHASIYQSPFFLPQSDIDILTYHFSCNGDLVVASQTQCRYLIYRRHGRWSGPAPSSSSIRRLHSRCRKKVGTF